MTDELDAMIRDLPPGAVSRSAVTLGFSEPLDRRWVRVEWRACSRLNLLCDCVPPARYAGALLLAADTADFPVVDLEPFSLVSKSRGGLIARVLLGQCLDCGTIYWAMKDED